MTLRPSCPAVEELALFDEVLSTDVLRLVVGRGAMVKLLCGREMECVACEEGPFVGRSGKDDL